MIGPRKFASLSPDQAIRKLERILQDLELRLRGGPLSEHGRAEFTALLGTASSLAHLAEWRRDLAETAVSPDIERVNDLRHRIRLRIGEPTAEWDLLPPFTAAPADKPTPGPADAPPADAPPADAPPADAPPTGKPAESAAGDPAAAGSGRDRTESPPDRYGRSSSVGPQPRFEVYLHNLRSPFNVGNIFRTADAAGVSCILLSPGCPRPGTPRVDRSSMGASAWVPWRIAEEEEIAVYADREGLAVCALETGGDPLWSVRMPERLLLLVGSEELGLPARLYRGRPVFTIPMLGRKASLNVGAGFAVAAFEWVRRTAREQRDRPDAGGYGR